MPELFPNIPPKCFKVMAPTEAFKRLDPVEAPGKRIPLRGLKKSLASRNDDQDGQERVVYD